MNEKNKKEEQKSKYDKSWLKIISFSIIAVCFYLLGTGYYTFKKMNNTIDNIVENRNIQETKELLLSKPRTAPVFLDFVVSYRILPANRLLDVFVTLPKVQYERRELEELFNKLFEKRSSEENMKRDVKKAMYTEDDSTLQKLYENTITQLSNRDKTDIIESIKNQMMELRKKENIVKIRALDIYIDLVKKFSADDLKEFRSGLDFYARREGIIDASKNYNPMIRERGQKLRNLIGI
jgi:hypothetical protein